MSSLFRIGTIYSRVDGLIRKGHIQENMKPIWFDVYKRFPPKYEPNFKRVAPDLKVKEIFYAEDVLRAKIHKQFPQKLGLTNLESTTSSFSKTMFETCQGYIAEGMTENEAIEKLKQVIDRTQEKPQKNENVTANISED